MHRSVSDTRKLIALLLAVMAFGLLVFGVALGISSNGPASGTRLLVSVPGPVNEATVAPYVETVRKQLGPSDRVIGGNDGLVVEIATQDPKAVADASASIETGHLHVDRTIAFTRTTGFLRAWPFFAIAAVMLAGGALLWRKR